MIKIWFIVMTLWGDIPVNHADLTPETTFVYRPAAYFLTWRGCIEFVDSIRSHRYNSGRVRGFHYWCVSSHTAEEDASRAEDYFRDHNQ